MDILDILQNYSNYPIGILILMVAVWFLKKLLAQFEKFHNDVLEIYKQTNLNYEKQLDKIENVLESNNRAINHIEITLQILTDIISKKG